MNIRLLSPRQMQSDNQGNQYVILSPSNKKLLLPTLYDSHSTLHSSNLIKENPNSTPKIGSFKKIKDMQIKQQNKTSKIVRKMILNKQINRNEKRLKTLDDAKSIVSNTSGLSSISTSKCLMEESIILMRGQDLQDVLQQQVIEPNTPYFRKRANSLTEEFTPSQEKKNKTSSVQLEIVKKYPALARCKKTGFLCHYEIVKASKQALRQINNLDSERFLQIYSAAVDIQHSNEEIEKECLVLYEPYAETLSEYISSPSVFSFVNFIENLIDVIKALTYLANSFIFINIEPSIVLMGNKQVKIKIRPCSKYYLQNQQQSLMKCGHYFNMLLSQLSYCVLQDQQKEVKGFTMENKNKLKIVIMELIKNQNLTFNEAYLSLQSFLL